MVSAEQLAYLNGRVSFLPHLIGDAVPSSRCPRLSCAGHYPAAYYLACYPEHEVESLIGGLVVLHGILEDRDELLLMLVSEIEAFSD